jgi:hypothetical protein
MSQIRWRIYFLMSFVISSVGLLLIGKGDYLPGFALAISGSWAIGALTASVKGIGNDELEPTENSD